MISRFFRAFFWFILFAAVCTWVYLGFVRASSREAIVVEHYIDGLDPEPIGPGDWRFIPARATPGQVFLHRVPIKDGFKYVYRRGLAQSDALGLKDIYYIKIEVRLSYSLNQDRMVSLFDRIGKDWSDLRPHIRGKVNKIFDNRITELYPNDQALPALRNRLENYLNTESETDIRAELEQRGVQLDGLTIKNVFVPDPVQYRAIVARSGEFITRELERIKQIDEAKTRETAARILDRAYFSRLEGIGRLLRKYPQLREYLAIDRLGGNVDVVVMPYDRYFGDGRRKMGPVRPPERRSRVLDRILRKRDRDEPRRRDRARDVRRRDDLRRGDNRVRRNPRPGNGRVNGNDFRNGGNGGFVDLTPP